MLVTRDKLDRMVKSCILKNIKDDETRNKVVAHCQEKYNIPSSVTEPIILLLKCDDQNQFVLFCLLRSIHDVTKAKIQFESYFTQMEISNFANYAYKVEEVKFPLRFPAIPVIENEQYIGTISSKKLMSLRKAQLVYYNTDTQRSMKRIRRGENVGFEVMVDVSSVKSIKKMMDQDEFIPNTITLNAGEAMDFEYDVKTKELAINHIDKFDIIDGFHRFVAICHESDENPDFDLNMELRITFFSADKAKNFIYQEEQKTRMRKYDIDTYNMRDYANIVTTRVNETTSCNLYGQIKKNMLGVIDFAYMAKIVNVIWFKDLRTEKQKALYAQQLTKELVECFNIITAQDERWMTKEYKFKNLLITLSVFSKYINKDKSGLYNDLVNTMEVMKDKNSAKFTVVSSLSRVSVKDIVRYSNGEM